MLQVNAAEFFCHPVPLGDNLYNKNRPKVVPPARGADSTTATQQKQAEQQPLEQSTHDASKPDKVSHQPSLTDHPIVCASTALALAVGSHLFVVPGSTRRLSVEQDQILAVGVGVGCAHTSLITNKPVC